MKTLSRWFPAFLIALVVGLSGCGKNNDGGVTTTLPQNQCQAGYVWNGSTCVFQGGGGGGQCQAPYVWNGYSCVYQGGGGGTFPTGGCQPCMAWSWGPWGGSTQVQGVMTSQGCLPRHPGCPACFGFTGGLCVQ